LSIKPITGYSEWPIVFQFEITTDSWRGSYVPALMLHHDEWNFVTSANGDKDAEIYRGQPIPMNVYSHLYYEQKINPTLGKHVAKAKGVCQQRPRQ